MYRVCVIAVFIFCLITVIVGCADDDEQNTKEESEQEVITVGDDYITLTINRRLGTFDILIDDFLYLQKVTSAIEVGTGGLVLPVNNLQAASVHLHQLVLEHRRIIVKVALDDRSGGNRSQPCRHLVRTQRRHGRVLARIRPPATVRRRPNCQQRHPDCRGTRLQYSPHTHLFTHGISA